MAASLSDADRATLARAAELGRRENDLELLRAESRQFDLTQKIAREVRECQLGDVAWMHMTSLAAEAVRDSGYSIEALRMPRAHKSIVPYLRIFCVAATGAGYSSVQAAKFLGCHHSNVTHHLRQATKAKLK